MVSENKLMPANFQQNFNKCFSQISIKSNFCEQNITVWKLSTSPDVCVPTLPWKVERN